MADIELVIKIDEKLYKDIYSDAEIMIYGGMRSGKTLLATLLRAIRNGTPLPKGHGRLYDEKAIRKGIKNPYQCVTVLDGLKLVEPIIMAESEEVKNEG